MIKEGIVEKIDNCFGTFKSDDKIYKFSLDIVYGNKITEGDNIKVRFDGDIPKIITKYEIIELEEILDVD